MDVVRIKSLKFVDSIKWHSIADTRPREEIGIALPSAVSTYFDKIALISSRKNVFIFNTRDGGREVELNVHDSIFMLYYSTEHRPFVMIIMF